MRAPSFLPCVAFLVAQGLAATGVAETPAGAAVTPAQAGVAAPDPAPGYDEDLDLDPAEPDFEIVDLPTNLRLPKHRLAFRLTHRFTRPLDEGDFSDLLADFFGFDGGAQIGLVDRKSVV